MTIAATLANSSFRRVEFASLLLLFLSMAGRPLAAAGAAAGPATQPAVRTSLWGPAVNGVQGRISAVAEIEQNMPFAVSLEMQSDPDRLAKGVERLNRFLFPAFLELSLTEVGTNRTLVVRPEDPSMGMPVMDDGRTFAALDGRGIAPMAGVFPLLKLSQTLAPGVYDCAVSYSSGRAPAGWRRDKALAGFWEGEVVSAPLRVRIVAETAKARTLLVPKQLRLGKELTVGYTKEDAEEVKTPVRNGYIIGTTITHGDGSITLRGGPPDGFMERVDVWTDYKGGDRKASYTIEVFETSVPAGHMWNPGPGTPGYKILWKKTIEMSYTEAQIRAILAPAAG